MAHVPKEITTHTRRVCQLYKRALRTLKDWNAPDEFRYQATVLRHRFDQNKNIKDLRLAKHLLVKGTEEWHLKRHPKPIIFPTSPGGVAYNRSPYIPDNVLDYWHPLEKAQFPKYFETREKRKKEYLEWYYKQYPEMKKKEGDNH